MLDKICLKGDLPNIDTKRIILQKQKMYCRINRGRLFKYFIPSPNNDTFFELLTRENSNKINLRGNLRKWRFGNSIVEDLNYGDYIKSIEMLSSILNIDIQYLWDLELMKLEIGANVKLPAKYSGVEDEILVMPKLDRGKFKNSIYFNGENHSYIFYDKIKEHKKLKVRSKERIKMVFHILRIEEKIKKKSGLSKKEKIWTLGAIRDNWDFLIDDWKGIINKTNLRNRKSELVFNPKSMTISVVEKQIIRNFIEINGLEKTMNFGIKYFKGKPSIIRNRILEIHNTVIEGEEYIDYYDIKKYVNIKAERMKSSKPKKWHY